MFLSSYINGVDKKGRVSIPASFRAEIALHSRQTVVVYASPDEGFLYAWGYDDFVKFAEKITKLPPLSKERQRLSRTILAAAKPLTYDGEGRMVLPEQFTKSAGIDGKVMFAGQGEYFTMWNPENYEAKQAEDVEQYGADIEKLSADWQV